MPQIIPIPHLFRGKVGDANVPVTKQGWTWLRCCSVVIVAMGSILHPEWS